MAADPSAAPSNESPPAQLRRRAFHFDRDLGLLEQFQQKCEAVLRPELRKNKGIEHLRNSEKSANALADHS
jgi:hypothetical protein